MTHFSVYGVLILLIICLTEIIGNFLLMIAYTKVPLKLIEYSSSYFIFNIAIVDLLSSCALLCNTILSFGNISIPEVAKSITVVLYTPSFSLHLSLAIPRSLSVAFPFWSRVNITNRACRWWVTFIWLANIVLEVVRVIVSSTTRIKTQLDLATSVLVWTIFFTTQCVYIEP